MAAVIALSVRASAQISEGPINLIAVTTLTPVTASQTLYMTPGAGVDAVENNIALPLGRRATFRYLACTTSAATGVGQNVAVSGRAGPCGSLVDTGAFSCMITGSATPGICTSGTTSVTISSSQCFALKVTTPAGLPANVRVLCTFEKSA